MAARRLEIPSARLDACVGTDKVMPQKYQCTKEESGFHFHIRCVTAQLQLQLEPCRTLPPGVVPHGAAEEMRTINGL